MPVAQTSINHYRKPETKKLIESQRTLILGLIRRAGYDGISIADAYEALGREVKSGSVSRTFTNLQNEDPCPIERAKLRPSKSTGVMADHWRITGTPRPQFNEELF